MDLEAYALRNEQLPDQETDKAQAMQWMSLCLVILLAAGPGLICFLFLLRFMFVNQSQEVPTTTGTMFPLNVPKSSVLDVTRPSRVPRSEGTTALPETRHQIPSYLRPDTACGGCRCRSLGQWIRAKLDHSVDPCQDFYAFVCNTFKGNDEFTQTQDSIRLFTFIRLIVPLIPESNQNSWQKAAGMYHACLNFVSSYEPETQYLVEWMRSLNLDLLNETRLTKVEPVEIMVRGSLDLGIHVVLSIEFGEKDFLNKKRVIKLSYSREQLYLYESRKKRALEDYIKVMTMYGATPPVDKQLASKIKAYNDHLDATYGTLPKLEQVYMTIFNLGRETSPYISPGEWHTFFSRYTNAIYGGPDQIFVEPHVLTLLVKLFKNESMGKKGLQYLVAWSVYRQLVEFTDPYMFLRGKLASDACYNHVRKVMNLAVITPFFQSEIPGYMVGAIKKMVSTIRSTYQKAFESSTWIGRSIREAAIRKLNNITSYVGSPGNRLDSKYVEEVYKPYPDAPIDLLFPTWIKALSLHSHYIWTDQTTPLYDEANRNSYYSYVYNDFTIPTADLLRPFAYSFGPVALTYGGLGMITAHEFMHAFDVLGIRTFGSYEQQDMKAFLKEYTKRGLCMRKSHKSVLSLNNEQNLSAYRDNENLADLVGTKIAYQAFASLIPEERTETLAGLDMSAEQLFFYNHCVKWCTQFPRYDANYAPHRSRCIVPLMNMPEFSNAYKCAAGTPMNPSEKCEFW